MAVFLAFLHGAITFFLVGSARRRRGAVGWFFLNIMIASFVGPAYAGADAFGVLVGAGLGAIRFRNRRRLGPAATNWDRARRGLPIFPRGFVPDAPQPLGQRRVPPLVSAGVVVGLIALIGHLASSGTPEGTPTAAPLASAPSASSTPEAPSAPIIPADRPNPEAVAETRRYQDTLDRLRKKHPQLDASSPRFSERLTNRVLDKVIVYRRAGKDLPTALEKATRDVLGAK